MTEEPQAPDAPDAEMPLDDTHPAEAEVETPAPTYVQDTWSGLEHYRCLIDGTEGWSYDSFAQHMAVYHAGKMIAAPPGYEPPASEDPPSEAVAAQEESAGQAEETETPDAPAPPPPEGV